MERAGAAGVITLLARPGTLPEGTAEVALAPEEARHFTVRRGNAGASVRVLDGRGTVATGVVVDGARVRIEQLTRVAPPPSLVLAVGAGDRERFGWLLEKAAELAVTEVIPLETERSRAVAGRLQPRHLDRLRERARQAIKQSGAAWAPVVRDPLPLRELGPVAPGGRWLADIAGRSPGPVREAMTVVIGPEGGWTAAERDWLEQAGFLPVRLAHDTLRFETAAIAAAAIVALRRREQSR